MRFRFFYILILGLAVAGRCLGLGTEPMVLGIVYKDQPVSFELMLTNAGPATMAVGEIKVSCDCLTVLDKPSSIVSGATVKIPCRYLSAKTGGLAVDVVVMGVTAASPIATYAVTGFVADQSWLLSPAEIARGSGDLSLVDTRSPARFAGVHIPHALNVPAFALKARADLKSRKIVLVDDGFEPSLLLAATASLRAQGFAQVFILDGGLASWVRQGHAVEGGNTVLKALAVAEISPADFFRACGEGIWQGVGMGTASASTVAGLFSAGFVQAEHAQDIGTVLAALPAVRENGARILVIPSEAGSSADVEVHLPKDVKAPIYYLKGGLLALTAYRAEQAALVANTGQTFQTKTSRRTPIVSGACGSCGK